MAGNDSIEPFSKHGTSYKSFILVFFLGSFGIAISVALMSLPPTIEFQQFRDFLILFAQSFGGVYAVSLAFVTLWYIFRYKHWIRKGFVEIPVRKWSHSHLQLVLYTNHNGNEKPVHGGHLSWLQIVIFGIGSVTYLVSVLVQVASKKYVDKIQVGKTLINLICCTLFIMFLKRYNGVFLKNTRFFQYSIAVMIGANVCQWISITMSPFWEHSAINVNISTVISNSSSLMSDVTDRNNFELVFDIIHSFLQPFFIEFLSISAECLLELRKTMGIVRRYHIEYKPDDTGIESHLSDESINNHSVSSRIIGTNLLEDNVTNQNESSRINATNEDLFQNYQTIEIDGALTHPNADPVSLSNSFKKCREYETTIVVVISACASVIHVVNCSIVLLPVTPLYKDTFVMDILNESNDAFVFAPLIVLLLVALYKLNKMNICMRKSQHFTGTDYLLLCTSSALFVYDILLIIGLVGLLVVRRDINTYVTILEIIFWAGSIVHIWAQTQFIITSQYVQRSLQKIPKFSRYTLIYLMSINAALWWCDSIAHDQWVENGKSDRLRTSNSMFGESKGVIMLVFLPIWHIYCFHSAVVAYRLLKTNTIKG